MWAYRFFQWLLRRAARVFFRRIEVVGTHNLEAVRDCAAIFCGNHPNSLIDPMLITTFCGRILHFAAKDVLFESWLLRIFLGPLGAVPVRRRKDHPDGPLDNEATFRAMYDVLAKGRAVGIFPEGISHNESQLQPLKTGAARIAVGAKRQSPNMRIALVPTGLCYFRRHRFRSSVLIQFGEPITIDEATLAAYDKDDRATTRALTDRVEMHMRALTVNAEDWDTLRVLDGVRRLYQPTQISLEDRVELARRFNTVYPDIKDEAPVRALFARVQAYLVRLSAAGLSDSVLRREIGVRESVVRVTRHVALLVFWLPLSIVGAPLHLPLGILFKIIGNRFAPSKDVVATTKFVLGFLTLILVYVGVASFVAWSRGLRWGLVVAALLPLSGGALVRVLARIDALRNMVATLVRVLWLRKEVSALREERAALEKAVVVAVDRYKPEDMVALFPRAPDEIGRAGSE